VSVLTLAGMVGVMFWINWRFTLIALSVAPVLFAVVYYYTRRIKKASREVRKKEGEIVSVIQEVLTSIRVVKGLPRRRITSSTASRRRAWKAWKSPLRARGMKAKLSPLVEIIVAVGASMVLWFGARMVLNGALSGGTLIVFVFLPGEDVQTHARSLEDDRQLLQGGRGL